MSTIESRHAAKFQRQVLGLAIIPAMLVAGGCSTMPDARFADAPAGYHVPVLHQSALKLADSIPQDKLTNASRQLAKEGIKALDGGDYEKASALFNMALKTDINNSYLHFLNGLTYHMRGTNGEGSLYALAQQGYDMAIQFDPSNKIARHYLGLLYIDRRDYFMAKGQLMEASLYDKNDAELLYDLAYAAYYAKDPATAYAALQGVLAAENHQETAQLYRALAIVAAAAGDDAAARGFLKRLGELSPSKTELGFTEGRVNTWRDNYGGQLIKAQFPGAAGGGGGFPGAGGGGFPGAGGGGGAFPGAGGGGGFPGAGGGGAFPGAGGGAPGAKPGGFYDKNMVMLDVAIIATEEDNNETFGVNLLDGLRIQFGNSSGTAAVSRTFTATDAGNTKNITRLIQIPAITYTINIANAQDRRNEVLARPSLVAMGGQPSVFFSGTDVIGAAVSTGQGGSVQVQKEAGVKLTVTPEFLPDNLIKIQVAAERTFLANPNSNVVFDFRLDTSKTLVNANVVLKYGETLILSGLSERNTESNSSGVPVLRDIPVVQYLFHRKTQRDFHKSVLILVTPRRPSYTDRAKEDIEADAAKMTEFERVQSEFEDKYKLWFKPVPTTAMAVSMMETGAIFREFRAGDLKLESWQSRATVGGRLEGALHFLYF